ncbi:MAG: YheT family hydrolase [Pseudobdellovibrionaceae bacterium]|jgi:predicted alpha/beta-fold hydrolase
MILRLVLDFKNLLPLEKPAWAPTAHAQTILGELLPTKSLPNRGRQMTVNVGAADQIICRLYENVSPFVFVFAHGISGSADSNYMQRIGLQLYQAGHTVILMNHRNCGEGLGQSVELYHSGRSDDLARLIYDTRLRYPRKKVIAIGFSMSGNTALLLQSRVIPTQKIWDPEHFESVKQRQKFSLPDAAIAVNPPVSLSSSVENFRNFNRFYEFYFLVAMTKTAKELQEKWELPKNLKLSPAMKLNEFDNAFTGPFSGFGDAMNYYVSCSSQAHVHKIDRPTVILSANDDPFILSRDILETRWSDSVALHLENCGGHLGYLHKSKINQFENRWMDYAIHEMTAQLISSM